MLFTVKPEYFNTGEAVPYFRSIISLAWYEIIIFIVRIIEVL